MDPLLKKLTRLRGVGVVLAARLRDSGLDSYERITAAGVDGLAKIRGINPRAINGILAQAAEMFAEESEKSIPPLAVDRASLLSERVQAMAHNVRDRFGDELKGKTGKKIEKELLKIVGFLDSSSLKSRKKTVVKSLAKAEKRLAIAEDAGLKKLRKCLKRTRKTLKRVTCQR